MFNKKKFLFGLVFVFFAVGFVFFVANNLSGIGRIKNFLTGSQSWYAIHLNNGQVYFGHVKKITPETITLSRVHYIEVYDAKAQTASGDNFQVQQIVPQKIYNLVKRGGDANPTLRTDNTLYINRISVLFWEKLSEDADIVKNIERLSK